MIYTQLYDQAFPGRIVRAGVIGTGHFATATVTQSFRMKRLDVPIVADIDVDAAKHAFMLAGVSSDDLCVAESRSSALTALESNKRVIVEDAMLLMDLPIDIIVESTGVPDTGARHATEAIRYGKHVAMVGKETDATVGPFLAHMAKGAGVVYTPVDGDQHGLLISLIEWAKELGLKVLCAGKARDAEFVYNPQNSTISAGNDQMTIDENNIRWLESLTVQQMPRYLQERQKLLAPLPQVGGFDLVEMAIVCNATGLLPERSLSSDKLKPSPSDNEGYLYCPALHTSEIPQVLAPQDYGGILANHGVIDCVTSLRLPHEAGLGGGVFLVVASDNDYSHRILTQKGCLSNEDESTALIYRPYHLCGVETPISLLNAVLLGQSTLPRQPKQCIDVIARTNRDFVAGEIIGNDHDADLTFLMHKSEPAQGNAPVPIHMANGNRLAVDVPAETILRVDMIEIDAESPLWRIRHQQDVLNT